MSRWYGKERQGFALGIYGMGMGGTRAGRRHRPEDRLALEPRRPFWIATALMAAMAIVFWLVARDAPKEAPTQQKLPFTAPLKLFGHSGRVWALTLFYFLSVGGIVALFVYLPKLLPGRRPRAYLQADGPAHHDLPDQRDRARTRHSAPCSSSSPTGSPATSHPSPEWSAPPADSAGSPPLLMAIVKSLSGSYALGFILLAIVAAIGLIVLAAISRGTAQPVGQVDIGRSGTAITP